MDTPRGVTQFGSLVVCLPSRHEGGQLRVSHSGSHSGRTESVFDWSGQDTSIGWAAFYSDCEHEVKEVMAGHRVTITYNLYAYEQTGAIWSKMSTIDKSSLKLYQCAKDVLVSADFLPKGTLGGLAWTSLIY